MKKWLMACAFFLPCWCTASAQDALKLVEKADLITYDWLVQYGQYAGYTDHIAHFNKIFKSYRVRNLLEFGVGFSTKYFLDECTKVTSVEFVTESTSPDWMKNCLNLYDSYSNWTPIVYFSSYQGDVNWPPFKYLGSECLSRAANYECSTHKSYVHVDHLYLLELNAFVAKLLKADPVDLVFVDPAIYLRGDIIQLMFGKAPVIVAHDTNSRAAGDKDDLYGFHRIATPVDYEEIFIPGGKGTTVWVSKNNEFMKLVHELKNYAKSRKNP